MSNDKDDSGASSHDAADTRLSQEPPVQVTTASKQALIYLRVSSASQLGGDYDRDGFSLPAQREACERKAASLDAEVAGEFVERGESGKHHGASIGAQPTAGTPQARRHRLRDRPQDRPACAQPCR